MTTKDFLKATALKKEIATLQKFCSQCSKVDYSKPVTLGIRLKKDEEQYYIRLDRYDILALSDRKMKRIADLNEVFDEI